MFLFQKPDENEINHFLDLQKDAPFSYREVGETRCSSRPVNYPINYLRAELGMGAEVYTRAVEAMRSWQMYNLNWTTLFPSEIPIVEGETYVVLVRHLGFWSLNPCRIVYTFEETESSRKTGFAVGTLPAHSEAGEERFTIEWNRETNQVFYEIFAFARAEAFLAQLGFPFVRLLQKQFAAESVQAMRAAIRK